MINHTELRAHARRLPHLTMMTASSGAIRRVFFLSGLLGRPVPPTPGGSAALITHAGRACPTPRRRAVAQTFRSGTLCMVAAAAEGNNNNIIPSARRGVGLGKGVARGVATAADRSFLRSVERAPSQTKPYTVLGIETSCDDTGVAVVRSDGTILGEAIASQAALHEEWGGVKPDVARDAHKQALDRVVAEALSRAGMSSVDDVDAVAVTVGPGLEICLRVGCEGAKALALEHDKPFVGVHHLEAHVLMARLAAGPEAVPFPFLTLLTSGGHCQLLLSTGIGEHAVIGSTLDDALGEAFDKVARLLELPIGGGGGPALEALARDGDRTAVALPVPMQRKKNFDFSFAGLKTAVRVAVERADEETRASPAFHANVAASFQHAAFRHLEQRLKYAMAYCASLSEEPSEETRSEAKRLQEEPAAEPLLVRTLVVSGGVAANQELRRRLQDLCDRTEAPGGRPDESWQLVVPPPRLCTDNGVMVAWAAIESLRSGTSHQAEGQEVRARWPLGRAAKGARVPGGKPSAKEHLRKGVAAP